MHGFATWIGEVGLEHWGRSGLVGGVLLQLGALYILSSI